MRRVNIVWSDEPLSPFEIDVLLLSQEQLADTAGGQEAKPNSALIFLRLTALRAHEINPGIPVGVGQRRRHRSAALSKTLPVLPRR